MGNKFFAVFLGLFLGLRAYAGDAVPAPEAAAPEAPEYGESLAPQQIIVTATRIAVPLENVPSSVSAVTADTAEARQYRTVNDLLPVIPGLNFYQSGGPGGVTGVFLRGMSSGYTKIMLDGMPLNDPSTPDNSFDFAGFPLDNLGQFEVLRGAQGSLYGASAVSGAINLTSKRGEGPLTGFFSTEAGSRGTVLSRLGLSAGSDRVDFSLGGGIGHTDGISAIDKIYGNRERDSFEQGNLNFRLGLNPLENLRFDLFSHVQVSDYEFDLDPYAPSTPAGPATDDPRLKIKKERYLIRPQATLSLFEGRWEQTAGFGYVDTKRKGRDEPFPAESTFHNPDDNRYFYQGTTWQFDYKSLFRLAEWNSLLAGVDVTETSMKTRSPYYGLGLGQMEKFGGVTNTGVYLEDQINFNDIFVANVGLRRDHHETFGDYTTWRGAASYAFPTATKLKASAGTGFRAPSLDQLYHDYPQYYLTANPSLEPEKSFAWDAGFEQGLWEDRFRFGATYFENNIRNMIGTTGDWSTYENKAGKTDHWGIEAFFSLALTDSLSLSGQYTWLRVRNRKAPDDKSVQLRRPLNSAAVNLDWNFREKGLLSLGVQYVGRRWDNDYNSPSPLTRLPSYALARIAASWEVNQHLKIYGRVENLFNKKYQAISNYGTEGISFYAGAALSF
ncbi:MAG: TonB-dependent receptor [Planctomycetota bacterium]|jgi:vitamin B12 transporter|nr:TonB-dependent receptor [Planctomycetota bacterium]